MLELLTEKITIKFAENNLCFMDHVKAIYGESKNDSDHLCNHHLRSQGAKN
jgi:hypothetical protein